VNPRGSHAPLRWAPLALAWALALPGCVHYPQRVPGPLILPEEPPPSVQPSETAALVTLQRDSDPVWYRRAGERGDVAVPFYAKRQRVPVGSLVRTGAGGRAELLWVPDATSIVLFDEGRVTVGDTEHEEPTMRIHSVSRALLTLTPEDKVELIGGARLTGDAAEPTGPIRLERLASILRITNQSKLLIAVAYRTEHLDLGPGESADLPILGDGSTPRTESTEVLQGGGVTVGFTGRVERKDDVPGVALTALEPAVLNALGIEARLEAAQTARFSRLSLVPPVQAADSKSP
jgi:hypothetical protein